MKYIDYSNMKIGMLKIINKNNVSKRGYAHWNCICDCGKKCIVSSAYLKRSKCVSCGCWGIENTKKHNKINSLNNKNASKENKYIIDGDIVKVYDYNNREFIIDLEDFEKVKNKGYWFVRKHDEYVEHKITKTNKMLKLHRFIMNLEENDNMIVDHINHNKMDNRKINLRICTKKENSRNISISKRNNSGIIGVGYRKDNNKWRARIKVDGKMINLGNYNNKTDAIIARLNGENKYFGEFAPQKHLFKEYGIEKQTV